MIKNITSENWHFKVRIQDDVENCCFPHDSCDIGIMVMHDIFYQTTTLLRVIRYLLTINI